MEERRRLGGDFGERGRECRREKSVREEKRREISVREEGRRRE